MIDDYAIADPAEETLDMSGDTELNSLEDADSASAVFCAPVLDRIRTSD